MKNSDFYDFGAELQKIVQTAIDSNDFNELNKAVRDTVNDAVEAVRSGVSGMSENKTRQRVYHTREQMHTVEAEYREVKSEAAKPQSSYRKNEMEQARYFIARPKGEILGTTMVVVGLTLGTMIGIGLAVLIILQIVLKGLSLLMVPVVILAVLFVLFMWMGVKGHGLTSRVKRFKEYRKILNGREFCDIEELAKGIGKSTSYVTKDIKRMIESKWFLQGHLDKLEKCLIVSDQMFEQYSQAQQSLEEREAKAKEETDRLADQKYSDEVRAMLLEGKRYIQHIRECNDAIPGVEISMKMSRLELIVSKIFAQVEKDPSVAPELHQFMNYYLPTMEKLLDAYRDLDAQPVQGQNINETKKEIEATIDTLNQAFEKLLDSFYRDLAWHVTTDISVLNTMLAKEGLTEDALQMKER